MNPSISKPSLSWSCPFPIQDYPRVLLAHGGGGRLMHQMIESVFISAFGVENHSGHDASTLESDRGRIAFTTDSFVVHPLFFPGGDIGSLAVHGTLNDLAMSGASPMALSAGFIIEEGFPFRDLVRIVDSMRAAALAGGVPVITGDTKVVERGKADGVYINTSGLGRVKSPTPIHPSSIQVGDVLLVNGDIGRHGMAIMALREGIEFESEIESDSSSVTAPVMGLLDAGLPVRCLRDLTRGGMAGALNEMAMTSGLSIEIEESCVPVRPDVASACELLGLDVFQVACEGRFVAFVPEEAAQKAVEIMRRFDPGACRVGKVVERSARAGVPVSLKTRLGIHRIMDMATGEQLPRIC